MAARHPDVDRFRSLTSLRTVLYKFALTLVGLLVGASVGREGPTVQIGAAIMEGAQRLFRIRLTAAVFIAGGAAGVSAAFNTPLAGVAFAIEELASAYEQKLALLVMAAVMISGLVSLGLAGDYLYFGGMANVLSLSSDLFVCPMAGVCGGLAGGLFARAVLGFGASGATVIVRIRSAPIAWAFACGLLIAVLGIVSAGTTWGTGYEPARKLVEGGLQPIWFAPAKFSRNPVHDTRRRARRYFRAVAGHRRRHRRCPMRTFSERANRPRRSAGNDRLFRRRDPGAADRGADRFRDDG